MVVVVPFRVNSRVWGRPDEIFEVDHPTADFLKRQGRLRDASAGEKVMLYQQRKRD